MRKKKKTMIQQVRKPHTKIPRSCDLIVILRKNNWKNLEAAAASGFTPSQGLDPLRSLQIVQGTSRLLPAVPDSSYLGNGAGIKPHSSQQQWSESRHSLQQGYEYLGRKTKAHLPLVCAFKGFLKLSDVLNWCKSRSSP